MTPASVLAARARRPELLLWLTPVAVALAVWNLSAGRLVDMLGALMALPVFVFFVRRPLVSLLTLVIFLPLELPLFSLLYTWHVPGSLLHVASSLKELLALALLCAGIGEIRATGRRLDKVDKAVLLYVAAVTLHLLVPHVFSDLAPNGWSTRLLAWRTDAGYPLLFLGARHAPWSPRAKELLTQTLLLLGGLVAALAVFQWIDPAGWSSFVLDSLHVGLYESNVLKLDPATVTANLAYLIDINPLLRTSSLFLSPFDMADYLVVVAAVAAVRITLVRRDLLAYTVLALSVAAIFFSRSRSDGLALLLVLVLVALPSARTTREGRMRLVAVLVLGAVLVVPALGGTRFVNAQGGAVSTSGHFTELRGGLTVLEHYPLGVGLGDNPSTATRFTVVTAHQVNPNFITDNLVLQVGDELGLQALLPWLAMMTLILLELRRRAKAGDSYAAALGVGLAGVVVAGMAHQVFLNYPVPWTLWAAVGLACAAPGRTSEEEPQARALGLPVTGVP